MEPIERTILEAAVNGLDTPTTRAAGWLLTLPPDRRQEVLDTFETSKEQE